ncbi:MAG: putative rane protein/putative transporter [Cyanobacteria bacterium RYN_339]|nr:putative rane protein/putative transporter [Cyanobacteria bacterium RYN_339]
MQETTPVGSGMIAQLRSYPRAFWFANWMELVERWAYYGVRLVLAMYIVGALNKGGLEFNHIQKGQIYLWWAIIASFLPMFTGGLADRYGYKKTIAVATATKILGYSLMATQHSYPGFFAGCMLLAAGTGLFKPGVQGLIAHSLAGKNASMGWGVFYELVNFGAFLGGILATPLREHSWGTVFYFNTALIALNFLPLLMFKENTSHRDAIPPRTGSVMGEVAGVIVSSVKNLLEPRLAVFILIFSGFWFSFNQLFDLLPNFIDDWTDVATLVGPAIVTAKFKLTDGSIAAEQILNLNSLMILLVMIPVGYMASKFKPLTAICVGVAAAVAGICISGFTMGAWASIIGVLVFTVGEMLASPRTKDFMASSAPTEKKGLYLGYSEVPNGLGWAVGSLFAGNFYEHHGDKVNFARGYLTEHGMTAEAVKAIPKEKVMDTLATQLHLTVPQATQMLWDTYHPSAVWYYIAGVGAASLVALVAYNVVISNLDRDRELTSTVPAAKSETPVS